MAYELPLANNILFHAFSAVSLLLALTTLYLYVFRALALSSSNVSASTSGRITSGRITSGLSVLLFLLSPLRNAFHHHHLLLASCCVYHVLRIVNVHGLAALQGRAYGQVQAYVNFLFALTAVPIDAMLLAFAGIMLGLFANLQWQPSRLGKRMLGLAHVSLSCVLVLAAIGHGVVEGVFCADPHRNAAWQSVVSALIASVSVLLVLPVLLRSLAILVSSPAHVRAPLLKLTLSACFGLTAAALLLRNLFSALQLYGFAALFTHRDPGYPPYALAVDDVEPFLELPVLTYVHSLVGTFCSLPFLFSASTAEWAIPL